IGKIFGAEFELYEHASAEPMIAVESFETPALLVSSQLRRLPVAQQVFLLAYGIGPIATHLHATMSLRPQELETVIIGAARVFAPNFSLRSVPITKDIEDAKEMVRKL